MHAMRILVVEDDPAIAGLMERGLQERGYDVDLADTGARAVQVCSAHAYDAIVLDRMLPDIGGLTVLERVRGAGGMSPVLILSALGSVEDRVEGLVAGADDYLAKPFDMDELSARLVSICRRHARARSGAEDDLVVGRLRLDVASHSVRLGDDAIELNRKQFSLLAYLLRHADRVVSRTMLIENVWGYAFDPATNIVESNLSRLRSRLQDLGCDPVETRRGEGYILRSDKCA